MTAAPFDPAAPLPPLNIRPSRPWEADGEQLTQAIITRRKRKCIAEGAHMDNCGRCGINEQKEVAA